MDGYAFNDLSLNLPDYGYGGKSVHISKRLEEIGAMQHESAFDFYGNISKLINGLHCAHTAFVQPCMGMFSWDLPIYFQSQIDNITGVHKVIGRPLYGTLDYYVDPRVNGAEILRLNMKGDRILIDGEISPDSISPDQAIAQWADEEEQISRNPYARWEYANLISFYERDGRYYSLPDRDYVTILFQTPDLQLIESKLEYIVYGYDTFDILDRACRINDYYKPDPLPPCEDINQWPSNQYPTPSRPNWPGDPPVVTPPPPPPPPPPPFPEYPAMCLESEIPSAEPPVTPPVIDQCDDLYYAKQNKDHPVRELHKDKKTPIDKKEQVKWWKNIMKKREKQTQWKERDRIDPFWRDRQKSVIEIGKRANVSHQWGDEPANLDEYQDPIDKRKVEILKERLLQQDPSLISRSNIDQNSHDDFTITYTNDDGSLQSYFIPSLKLCIIRILSFMPSDLDEFQWSFYQIVRIHADINSPYKADKLFIDLRYNGGGYARLPFIVFRFLFPHADSPVWPPMNVVKSPINAIFNPIKDYFINQEIEDTELQIDEKTGDVIYNYYQQEGELRTTSIDIDGVHDEVTADLTKRAVFYAGHTDNIRKYAQDWDLNKRPIWQPKDVTVIVDGLCISACAIFAKEIHQKNVGRIISVGNFGGVFGNTRYNAGTAGGSSIRSSDDFEYYKYIYDCWPYEFDGIEIDPNGFPEPFYREGTLLSYVEMETYGVTENTKDKLNEFFLYDADLHLDFIDNVNDLSYMTEFQIDIFYRKVVNHLSNTLGFGSQAKNDEEGKNCLYGEHELNGTQVPDLCIEGAKSNPNAYYGFKCNAQAGRNEDGTRSRGQFVRSSEGCEFAFCRSGFSRSGDKCVADMPLVAENDPDPQCYACGVELNISLGLPVEQPQGSDDQPGDGKDDEVEEGKEEQEGGEQVKEKETEEKSEWRLIGLILIIVGAVLIVIVIFVIVFGVAVTNSLNERNRKELEKHSQDLEEQQLALIRERQRAQVDRPPAEDDTENLDKSKRTKHSEKK